MDRLIATNDEFDGRITFTPRQQQASQAIDDYLYTLYGGARGGGKSWLLRVKLVKMLKRWGELGFRNVRVMLACENYPALRERQITKIQTEFPASLGTYYGQRNEFVLHDRYGSGVIALRNLDDPTKYQSAEFAAIAVDEITKNPERAFHVLRGSLRWPGIKDVRMMFTANPDSGWVRRYWIEREFPAELQSEAGQFVFVPALPTDNPHLDQSYWQMLSTLPGALREAWLKGNWFAGVEGLVYSNFDEANVTEREPVHGRPWELAIDDGYIDPRATLLIQKQSDGSILVFDELYQTQALEEETIEAIGAKMKQHNLGAYPVAAAVSHEAVALRRRLTEARMPAVNWMQQSIGGGQSTRLAAITLTRSMICDGKGRRNILIHRRCKNLLSEIRSGYKYPEGKNGLETEPQDGNDHAVQALESYIWYRYGGNQARKPRTREY